MGVWEILRISGWLSQKKEQGQRSTSPQCHKVHWRPNVLVLLLLRTADEQSLQFFQSLCHLRLSKTTVVTNRNTLVQDTPLQGFIQAVQFFCALGSPKHRSLSTPPLPPRRPFLLTPPPFVPDARLGAAEREPPLHVASAPPSWQGKPRQPRGVLRRRSRQGNGWSSKRNCNACVTICDCG